jgi:uncharacterized protein DUF3592
VGGVKPVGAVAAGLLLFLAGLVVGVWTLEQYRGEQDRLDVASRAAGTVTGQLNGRPIVAFSLPGGDRVSFTAAGVRLSDYPVGTQVDVLYRADLPSEAVIDRPRARWVRAGLLGALSFAVMAFGAYLSWYARRYDIEGRV